MARSVDSWRALIKGKTDHQIALLILGDLIGYRKTSMKRADDADTLTNLLSAIASSYHSDT